MENYVSNTNTPIPNEQKSTLWRGCRRVEAYFYLIWWVSETIRMCTGNPRPRETAVSCADRQRPAALPLPAWEQREPEQPQQESPAHHHQVQWSSTLYLWNTSRTHFTFPTWNHFASSTLSRVVLIDLSVAFFFFFFWHRPQETHSLFPLLDCWTVWKTRANPESMTHLLPPFNLARTFHAQLFTSQTNNIARFVVGDAIGS